MLWIFAFFFIFTLPFICPRQVFWGVSLIFSLIFRSGIFSGKTVRTYLRLARVSQQGLLPRTVWDGSGCQSEQ